MKIKNIWNGGDALGEGPLWHPVENVLYWIDIARCLLHRLNPETGEYREWQLPDHVGTIAWRASGGLIATIGHAVVALSLPDCTIKTLAQIKPWPYDGFMNEGKCDRLGRFWFGIASRDVENPTGGLYRLDPDGTLTQMEQSITISNGLGWSPDNKIFYYTDGLKYCIYQYDFNLSAGTIYNRKIFVQLVKSPIEPDGLTIDRNGHIWEAQWNSGKLFEYTPDGREARSITLPTPRPTSCIFGGRDLDILYITSCSHGKGEVAILPPPAGSLFAVQGLGISGLPEPAFAG